MCQSIQARIHLVGYCLETNLGLCILLPSHEHRTQSRESRRVWVRARSFCRVFPWLFKLQNWSRLHTIPQQSSTVRLRKFRIFMDFSDLHRQNLVFWMSSGYRQRRRQLRLSPDADSVLSQPKLRRKKMPEIVSCCFYSLSRLSD